MRTPKIVMALFLSMSIPVGLAGCTAHQLGIPSLQDTSVDEKALFVAESAFQGLSLAIEQGVDSGVLHGEQAQQVQVYYRQAKTALDKAREAQRVGQHGLILEQALLVQELVAKAFALFRS